MAGRISKNLERFVRLYAVVGSVTKAAEEVGLTREYCSSSLRREDVQALLAAERAKVAQQYAITQQEIIENLKMLANPANIEARLTSPAAARAANRDLGELLGMWQQDAAHSGEVTIRIIRDDS